MPASGATWEACIGPAAWLSEPLHRILSYPQPLPVQQAVIPTITRALTSGVPNDVSLTAPTGSGKTLCYLIPLARLLTDTKRGVDDNALRCLILVPTHALGQQVYRELQRLTRPSSIKVACICAEAAAEAAATAGGAARAEAAEAAELVRRVVVPRLGLRGGPDTGLHGDADSGEEEEAVEEAMEDEFDADEEHGSSSGSGSPSRLASSSFRCPATSTVRYFSNVDVIVATPQRLLHHLDHTRGLRLADLRLLVIDEADQVLAGNFAAQVQKVNARYEFEVEQRQRRQERQRRRMAAVLAGTASSATSLGTADSNAALTQRCGASAVLHKVLCSATLSSRIARISQVKLRNCSYYVLDSNGAERTEEAALSSSLSAARATGVKKGTAASMVVRTQFALPPTLQEHVIFVEDTYRPAVLLKLVHELRRRIAAARARARAAREEGADDASDDLDHDGANAKTEVKPGVDVEAAVDATAYPAVEAQAGTGILVFCATAEEARVMSHFLAAAGVPAVLEFTTLSSEAERRRALLEQHTGVDGDDGDVSCVVASDALMRGIDIPNVGHVIMYHPPDAVSQYVHRAGRTARAMRPGHVHLLLSKMGASGTQDDGEVALYKRLSESLSRTLPVSYERRFFRFAEAPGSRAGEKGTTAAAVVPAAAPEAGTAEWWVAQAGQFLVQSQHQLQRRWASVLESAAAAAAAAKQRAAATTSASPASGTASARVSSSASTAAAASSSASTAVSRKRHRAVSASGAQAAAAAGARR